MGSHCRIDGSIDHLPDEVREAVDKRLQDKRISFTSTVEWLNNSGFQISYSAFIRYVKRTNKAAQRLADTMVRAQALTEVAKNMPDVDFTKASAQILLDGLVERITSSPEEFAEISIEKAGRMVTALQKNYIEEKKIDAAYKSKAALVLEQMSADFKDVFSEDKELAVQFSKIVDKIRLRAEKIQAERGM
ncbi:MAG: phage protein Gp27 family protein [Christensenella sp.]